MNSFDRTARRQISIRPFFVRALRSFLLAFAVALSALGAGAMSVVPPSFEQLVGTADQIVQVEVKAVRCRWDENPGGRQVIHTYVDCRVDEVLKGVPKRELTLRFLGGQVGDVHMEIPDMPNLEVGGTYILFLAENGRAVCPLVKAMHGSYRVLTDPATGRAHVTRHNGEALHSTADVQRTFTHGSAPVDVSGLDRDAFVRAILGTKRSTEEQHAR